MALADVEEHRLHALLVDGLAVRERHLERALVQGQGRIEIVRRDADVVDQAEHGAESSDAGIAGLYMVMTEQGGFGFDVLFVQVGLPIAVVLLLAGPLYFGPTEEGLAEIAERDVAAAGNGEVAFSDEFERAYRRLRAGNLSPPS